MKSVGTMELKQNQMITKSREMNAARSSKAGALNKLLMEYRCWDGPEKLPNGRTGFRDRKMRFKDSLGQLTKFKAWKQMVELLEKPEASCWEIAKPPAKC